MNTKALTQVVTTPQTDKFVRAVIGLLRPVVRLILGRMTGTVLLDLMRRVLVQEAYSQLHERNHGKVTLSEVALLTGIDSRMVKQLIRTPPSCTEADLSGEARVLFDWYNDAVYHDPNSGKPNDLLLFGPGYTFQSLVSRAAGRNVTVQTVLERLLASGNVVLIGEHWVRMVSHCYQIIGQEGENCPGEDCVAMQNLGTTLMHNMQYRAQQALGSQTSHSYAYVEKETSAPWVQKQCLLSGLSPEQTKVLRQRIEALLAEQIITAEKAMAQAVSLESDIPVYDKTISMGVGYFYWERQEEG